MPVKDYKEKEIRKQILNKIKPQKGHSRRSKHEKGYIYLEGKLVAKVKIPNDHQRVMKHSKSQFIASDLKLDADQFNCPMTGPRYYEILKCTHSEVDFTHSICPECLKKLYPDLVEDKDDQW